MGHSDLKPDNLLMTMNKTEIQICDFGSAMDVTEQVRTSYCQPRYYRAPEIMLGIPYDTQIDVWSAGTTIFELATGDILFTGKSNNQMLRQQIDLCGRFPKRMISEGEFCRKHFNAKGDFLNTDKESSSDPAIIHPPSGIKRPVLSLLKAQLKEQASGLGPVAHDEW